MPAGKSDSGQEKLFSIELLTIQQVADWAKVSPKTIYRWSEAFQQVIRLTPEEVQVVTACDREADFYEMFVTAKEEQADLLVRANTDRQLR